MPDFQLSLAIGKEGQNARLAAKLTGWKIDIKSESQLRADIEQKFLILTTVYMMKILKRMMKKKTLKKTLKKFPK